MRTIALYMPGDAEIALLERLQDDPAVRVTAVVDPSGMAVGAVAAAALGIPVHMTFPAARLPADAVVVGPAAALAERGPQSAELARRRVRATEDLLAELSATAASGPAAPPPLPPPPAPPEALDPEAALDALERGLDRDRLLPWLLSLARDAMAADGGSLMLHDPRGEELFLAAAEGLSRETLLTTRLPLGEGVAGRVAAQRQAELVRSAPPADVAGDRDDLGSAVVTPLLHDGELLGVLNLNRRRAAPAFGTADLEAAVRLAQRLAGLLARVDGAARSGEGALRHRLTRRLLELAADADRLEAALAGWAGAFCLDLAAESASLAVVRDDSELLVAEGDAAGITRIGDAEPGLPAWDDVLRTGRPLVARQAAAAGNGELTLVFLPVGRGVPLAILGLTFATRERAHRFQGRASAVIDLLEARLPVLLERFRRRDQLRRQDELARILADVPGDARPRDARLTSLRLAFARLVGAREAVLVLDGAVLASSSAAAPSWAASAPRLLATVDHGHWLAAAPAADRGDAPDRPLLAVPVPGRPDCGVVMAGKERHHAADSLLFTPFDAELALRLARVLPYVAGHEAAPVADAPSTDAPDLQASFQALLGREMARADRYHTTFCLGAYRLPDDADAPADLLDALRRRLRATDVLHRRSDGLLLLLSPEEANGAGRLQARVLQQLRDLCGRSDLRVRSGRALYPGPYLDPAQLLAKAEESLASR